jgi:hypothetical protein
LRQQGARGADGRAGRMRMVEANLFPVIPQFHAQRRNREVTSMSDMVQTGRRSRTHAERSRTLVERSRTHAERSTVESRLMFGACYVVFLVRAVTRRLTPWRKPAGFGRGGRRESIFSEASSDAGVLVASSFMGL